VTAVSQAGNTHVSSDGVTIVTENDVLSGVMIYDGVVEIYIWIVSTSNYT
jgi:hypothetical protein